MNNGTPTVGKLYRHKDGVRRFVVHGSVPLTMGCVVVVLSCHMSVGAVGDIVEVKLLVPEQGTVCLGAYNNRWCGNEFREIMLDDGGVPPNTGWSFWWEEIEEEL